MKTETTKPKKFCFVLMPFNDSFNDVYELGIKATCKECGAYSERVDEQIFQGTILERIYNQISKSDFIIADMSGRNPNVFYEVGYAHSLGKPTILLTNNSEDIPFDLKHYPHIIYNNVVDLKKKLKNKLKWFIANDEKNITDKYKINIDLFFNNLNLSKENPPYEVKDNMLQTLNLTIKNSSNITFNPGDFQLGILVTDNYQIEDAFSKSKVITNTLPDGRLLHVVSELDRMFPESYITTHFSFGWSTCKVAEETITFIIYTTFGTREYKLKLKYQIGKDLY